MKIERYFTENGEGTIEFTPIAVDHARLVYRQLIERLSYLRKKIDAEQNLLDITPKENDDLKKDCLEKLFMFKTGLGDVENQFQSVKRWFDKNKLPYPESPEDQLKKDEQRIILEEWISRRRKKVGDGKILGKQKSKEIKKPKKKKTVKHSQRIIDRNREIRSRYHKLTETDHLKSKYAISKIAEEHRLSFDRIRDIIYKGNE